ncbi:M43 family zinc metalloprotease [Lacihabitans lacunae]|uniref:M43 family zinc metalloprotease n=1 Tax=Lacihabitans lacunae TaxID=1028214 RepID=A0ABV7YT71_9BACT
MKKIIASALLFFLPIAVFSQACGSISGTSTPNTASNSNKYWVKVYYHIVRTSSHTGGYAPSLLCNITSKLNQDFNQYGIYFVSNGSDFVDNDSYFNLGAGTSPYSANVNNVINIYLLNSYTGTNPTFAGCAQDIPSSAFWIVNSAINDAVSHEMGHCLGLYHTHRGNPLGPSPETGTGSCMENINGSNCTTCGDKICDTPASPNLILGAVDANCNYLNPSGWTQNGVIYNPDTRNIMSYSPCKTRFSTQQVYAMKNRLVGASEVVSLAFPTVNGSNNVCSSSNFSCSNLVAGYTVIGWTSSNTAVATINSGGVLTKVSDGLVTITATIAQGCSYYYASKVVFVGVPSMLTGTYSYGTFTYPISNPSTGISVSSSTPNIYINLLQTDPNASFNWATVSSGGTSTFSFNAGNASLNLSAGAYRNISCYVSNICGNSPTTTFNCYNYSRSFSLTAFPNPASTDLSISADEVISEQEALDLIKTQQLLITDDIKKVDLSLYGKNGLIALKGKFTDKKVKFDVQKVPNGTYFLHVGDDANKVIKQIIIQH